MIPYTFFLDMATWPIAIHVCCPELRSMICRRIGLYGWFFWILMTFFFTLPMVGCLLDLKIIR